MQIVITSRPSCSVFSKTLPKAFVFFWQFSGKAVEDDMTKVQYCTPTCEDITVYCAVQFRIAPVGDKGGAVHPALVQHRMEEQSWEQRRLFRRWRIGGGWAYEILDSQF